MHSSPPRSNRSCWIVTSAVRTSSGSGSASNTPSVEFSSSTSPIAAMRTSSLPTRRPSPRPVVPSSPVRVAILLKRWPMRMSSRARPQRGQVGLVRDYRRPRRGPQRTLQRRMNRKLTSSRQETRVNHPHTPAATRRPLPPAMLDALRAAFGERVSTADAVRAHHGRDESPFDPQLPDVVVFARSADEVREVVSLCALYSVPLIPYGAGSSLEGHLLAVRGGVSLDP